MQRRLSWPGQNGKPVYNFRSEGREFASGRCLIPANGFYEFTDPADKMKKRKDKWLFTKKGEPWHRCRLAVRQRRRRGPPDPHIAPYHDRQLAILIARTGLRTAPSIGFSEDDLKTASSLSPSTGG